MNAMSHSTIVAAYTALLGLLSPVVDAQSLPPEVQVGPRAITDFEFDWGRDGEYCPTCNYGDGNNRLTYVDQKGNVWVAHVDVATGNFVPTSGKETLVDTNAVTAQAIGNGSEWVALPAASALAYTRNSDVAGSSAADRCIGIAQVDTDGVWSGGCMPGSEGYSLPLGTTNVGDPYPMVNFQNKSQGGTNVFWQLLAQGSVPQTVMTGKPTPPSRRWIPNTHAMVLTAASAPDASGNVYQQVFLYQTDSGSLQRLTFDPANKASAFMWAAPEFNNSYVFLAMSADATEIDIYAYRQNASGSSARLPSMTLPSTSGPTSWQVIKRIVATPDYPYFDSPEPFVYQNKSWVFFSVLSEPREHGTYVPGQIAISGIEPTVPSFRVLTADVAPVVRTRRDPEYYITANGPYVYYNRVLLSAGAPLSEGVFRVDAGLGPP